MNKRKKVADLLQRMLNIVYSFFLYACRIGVLSG